MTLAKACQPATPSFKKVTTCCLARSLNWWWTPATNVWITAVTMTINCICSVRSMKERYSVWGQGREGRWVCRGQLYFTNYKQRLSKQRNSRANCFLSPVYKRCLSGRRKIRLGVGEGVIQDKPTLIARQWEATTKTKACDRTGNWWEEEKKGRRPGGDLQHHKAAAGERKEVDTVPEFSYKNAATGHVTE